MSGTREMCFPEWEVNDDAEEGHVRLRFVVPGSKFGPVEVVLDAEQATELAEELTSAAEWNADDSGPASTSPQPDGSAS